MIPITDEIKRRITRLADDASTW
ncbi:MAG: hypothetical protein R2726_21125 [Acidimicrobiales bacterium]